MPQHAKRVHPHQTGFRLPEGLFAVPGLGLGMLLLENWGRRPEGGHFFTLFDDAAISMTYARTLAETGELVWFPGAERVEGISNLLWTVVMSAVHAAGLSGSSAALAVSLIGLSALVLHSILVGSLTGRLLADVDESSARFLRAVAVLVSGTAFPLLFWTLRGFETGIIALLYVALLHKALDVEECAPHRRSRCLAVLALLSVTVAGVRLDALLVPVFVVGWLAFRRLVSRGELARLAAGITSGVCLIAAWRYAYFASIVPNTYFLKVSDAPALLRIQRGLFSSGKILPILLLVLLAAGIGQNSKRLTPNAVRSSRMSLLAGTFLLLVAYSVYVGGDAWEWTGFLNRFVSPGLGIAIAVVSAGAAQMIRSLQVVPEGLHEAVSRAASPAVFVGPLSLILAVLGDQVVVAIVQFTPIDEIVRSQLGFGINAGPSDWGAWFSVNFAGLFWGLALASSLVISAQFLWRGSNRPAILLLTAVLISAVWSSNNVPASLERGRGGIHVADDAFMANFGRQIRDATREEASIAIVWAGNIAYYSERSVIDILGKSDALISRLRPQVSDWRELHPGHNKWDYGHSIAALKPDMVAQVFWFSDSDMEDFSLWGYERFCLGGAAVFVAVDTPHVDRSSLKMLSECPQAKNITPGRPSDWSWTSAP